MALTTQEIEDARSDLTNNSRACPGGCDKIAMRAAVDYTGSYIQSIRAAWIAGLPEPFKSESTAAQKAMLWMHVSAIMAARRI